MNTIPAASGIYQIVNTANNFVYLGASKNCRARIAAHRRALANGTHSNRAMQADYTANPSAFLFEIGEIVPDPDQLQDAENRAMELHAGICYNKKPSNMRVTSASEKDAATFRAFHDWRILLYGRLPAMDPHILKTLQGDLESALERIAGELERRAQPK